MTLLDEINARKPVRLCRFGKWLQTASEQDRDDLAVAFEDGTIAGKWIADALANRGVQGHIVDCINDHRRGACDVCPAGSEHLNVSAR